MKQGSCRACWAILAGLALALPAAGAEGLRLPPQTGFNGMPISSAVSLAAPEAAPAMGREQSGGRMRARMTPEERRSLRQDVSGAGRTLYLPDDKRLPPPPGR